MHQGGLPELAKRFPNLTIAFDTESTERVVDLVSLRHYDIGLVCSPHEQEGLVDQQLFTAHAVAAIPLRHAMAKKPKVALADLAKQRVILPGRTSPLRLALEKEIAAAGLRAARPDRGVTVELLPARRPGTRHRDRRSTRRHGVCG